MSFNFSSYSIVLFFILVISSGLMLLKKKKNLNFIIMIITVITLFFLSSQFNPYKAMENGDYTDLYRYYNDMNELVKNDYDFSDKEIITNYSSIPIIKIVVYLIAKIKMFNLLPMISAFIVYGGITLLLYFINKKFNVKSDFLSMAFIIGIVLINYKTVITNIRMPIGTIIYFIILYFDCVKKRGFKKCFIYYALLCMIHLVFVLFLALRVLVGICNNKKDSYLTKFIYFLLIIYSFTFVKLVPFIEMLNISNGYLANLIFKIDYYMTKTQKELFELPIMIINIAKVINLLFLLKFVKNKISKDMGNLQLMYDVSIVFVLFTIGSIWSFYMFDRFSNFLIYFIIFWYVIYNNICGKSEKKMSVRTPNLITYINIGVHTIYFLFSFQYQILCF